MSSNKLQPATLPRESEPRDHRVILSVTAAEFDAIRGSIPALEERLGRRVVPVALAAYHFFQRGLQVERVA